ncbi:pollen-specific leucine-rich repeat extensin-like protein 3 [Panicum miliaceum]|uniref:Pollen-specific leucine-rich repeat extensin-like protein 3 n=1 Tax=Panicum miliaceum TaxID=4540 RepID=A0A3L6Q0R3_PANMI|nr:pollen-specific leucine-rich repeat extensin-like protein 3 [Panicum miliaceum]
MAEKISMIIVVVDLDCHKCYNKIRKILCQLQDCERIRTISFDDKSKTITIVGPFDPHRLACKLRCKGGKVIRDIHIVDSGGGKPPQKMAEAPPPSPAPAKNGKPPKHKEKPPAAEPPPPPTPPPEPAPAPPPDMPPPSPAHQAPEMSAMVPAFVEEKQPRAKPAELEPPPMDFPSPMPVSLPPPPVKERFPPPRPPCRPLEQAPVEYVIPTVEIPSWPAPPVGPCGCPCCAPCYQGYYEGCRCCCSGRLYVQPLPAPAGCGYRGCRTFSDEDPTAACSIM